MFYQLKSYEEQKQTTAGLFLKGTRELRQMTQEQLALVTGIDLKIIQSAENDSINLSIENAKILALELRCHPSSLVFSEWKLPPYQPEEISVDGLSLINDKIESKNLKIYLNKEFGLKIRGIGSNKYLDIRVFNSSMATALSFNNFKDPIKYNIEGNILGTYSESYGSCSETEYNIRIVKKLSIKIEYNKNFANFEISGLATIRDGKISRNSNSNFTEGNWNFIIQFYIPNKLIAKCYGLYPDAEKYILSSLAKL